MVKKKCIILFSGGLDSRLVVKIMQKKGFAITAVYFKLPFSCSNENEVTPKAYPEKSLKKIFTGGKDFVESENLDLKIFDCTKGKLLQEYLKVIKDAKHGVGAGANPCIDCKIFMFKKAKEFADKKKIKFIVTGEVIGQRPMSQQGKQIKIIEKESKLDNRIIRPLVDLGIHGRQRKKQMSLAKKFKIKYPPPAGGCLLCEKYLKCRFEKLLKRGLNDKEIKLIGIGRHFFIKNSWIILGRNHEENKILESIKIGHLIEPDFIGPSALILGKTNKEIITKVNELIKAYSKKGSLKKKEKFKEFKI